MQDQLMAFWRLIEGRLRLVMMGVFALFLLVIAGIRFSGGASVPQAAGGGAAALKDVPVPEDVTAILAKCTAKDSVVPVEKTDIAPLIVNSMFDVKAIQNAIEQEGQANQKYEQALQLKAERKYPLALGLCREVLAIRPSHQPAKRLMEELEGILAEARPQTRTPAATPEAN